MKLLIPIMVLFMIGVEIGLVVYAAWWALQAWGTANATKPECLTLLLLAFILAKVGTSK